MVFRPATPGFVVTLAATICLALVSFGVPLLKSFYFLSATIDHDGLKGTATFGTLGYCLQTGSSQACSNATVGWEFNPNTLLSLDLPLNLEIPTVVVKWLTYVLVLHIVGLGLAAISAIFGLLAHIREMAMTCFSSCISGMAASVTLLAFIFDIVFFIVIRTRVRAVGGTANIGNALWLTLAAWVLLFFAGCFFGIGRCCFASRPRGPKGEGGGSKWSAFKGNHGPGNTGGITHQEAMRLEAIKAEEDRKARQAEVGLPAFPTNGEARPLKQKSEAQYYVEEDSEDEAKPYVPVGHAPAAAGAAGPQRRGSGSTTYTTNYAGRGRQQPSQQQQQQPQYAGGYMQGAPGTRTIDAYNNNAATPAFPSGPAPGAYRQPSTHSNYQYASTSSPPPMPVAQGQQYLTPGAAVGEVFPGHGPKQSSYHSAVSHQVGVSTYSQFDQPYNDPYQQRSGYNNQGYGQTNNGGYDQQSQQQYYPSTQTPAPYNDPYGNTSAPYGGNQNAPFAGAAAYDSPARTYSPQQQQQQQQQYGYDDQQGYGARRQPTLPQVNTGMAAYNNAESRRSPTSPRGPRSAGAGHVNPPWSQQPQQQQDYNSGYQTPGNYDNGRDSGPLPPIPSGGSGPLPSLPANGSGPLPNIPQEAPPGYELPPGAAPPGAWPKEKR